MIVGNGAGRTELIAVPTSSVPTTGEFGSRKSVCRSFTRNAWMSPVSTTGLETFRSCMACRTVRRSAA